MSNFNKVPFMTGMRRMFYAVTPNETSFETREETPEIINEVTFVINVNPDIKVKPT